MENIAPEAASAALAAVGHARAQVAEEVGLPRWYWWGLAAGWVLVGAAGVAGPTWLPLAATLAFGAAHATVASRLLSGQQRTSGVRVSADVAGARIPLVVIGMLFGLVVLTIGVGFALDADGARHAGLDAALVVAAAVGLGGPEILSVLRRWAGA